MDHLLIAILVGLVAGFLASRVVSGHGYGLLGDVLIGILGALVGTFLLGALLTTYILVPLGLSPGVLVGQIVIAFIGAVVVLAIMRLVSSRGYGRRRRLL